MPFQKETIFNFKLLLFHWRRATSITKTYGNALLEWFTRCGEAPHGSVREFLGVRYFRPLESKNLVKTVVPSADVNGPCAKREQIALVIGASFLLSYPSSFAPEDSFSHGVEVTLFASSISSVTDSIGCTSRSRPCQQHHLMPPLILCNLRFQSAPLWAPP